MLKSGILLLLFTCTSCITLFSFPPKNVKLPITSSNLSADQQYKDARTKLIDMHTRIGTYFKLLGKEEEALLFFKTALSLSLKNPGKEHPKTATIYLNIGTVYDESRKYEQALRYYRKALSIRLKTLGKNHPETAKIYSNTGKILRNLGRYDEAFSHIRQAITILAKADNNYHLYKSSVYINLGSTYSSLRKTSESFGAYQKALDICLENPEESSKNLVIIYYNFASLYINDEIIDDALIYAQKALEAQLKAYGKMHYQTALCYRLKGVIYTEQGNYEAAFDAYQKANYILKETLGENHIQTADLYENIGDLYRLQGHLGKALDYHKKALTVKNQIFGENHITAAKTFFDMGNVYIYQEAYKDALSFHKKALNLFLKNYGENHYMIEFIYSSLATACRGLLMYKKALEYSQKSITLSSKFFEKNYLLIAQEYNNTGVIYEKIGNYDSALYYYQLSLDMQKRFYIDNKNHPDLGYIYNNIGVIFQKKNDFDQALYNYRRSLRIRLNSIGYKHALTGNVLDNIGTLYEDRQDYDESLRYYQKALKAFSFNFSDETIYKNPQLTELNSKADALKALINKASMLRQRYRKKTGNLKDLEAAFQTFLLAADLIELTRNEYVNKNDKQLLNENSISTFENCISTAHELYQSSGKDSYLHKAFECSERGKSILLLQALKDTEAKNFSGIPDSLLVKEKELQIDIAFYETQLFEVEQKKDSAKTALFQNYLFDKSKSLRQLTEKLEKDHPNYYRLKYDTRVASVQEIREKLITEKTALIEYFAGDSTIYIFTITNNDFQLTKQDNAAYVNEKIKLMKTLMAVPPKAEQAENSQNQFITTARKLYKILIPTLENSTERVVFVPDGILNYLPFDILLTQPANAKTLYSKLPYLLKKYDLSYGYSATLLLQNQKKEGQNINNRCLAFAPSYKNNVTSETIFRGTLDTLRNNTFVELPGAQREVKELANYFTGKFYFNQSATEKRFKKEAGNYGIIHLAMHGQTDEKQPMNSKLIFTKSSGDTEDGFLYAYELYNMNLNAELAVLSACRTGGGQYIRGEGIMSLARGFIYAGVQSVILTLWDTDDRASAKIIARFYELLNEGEQKDKALKKAKIDYLSKSNNRLTHPFYWAGFTPVGNMQPIKTKKEYYVLYRVIAAMIFISLTGIILLIRKKRKNNFTH